MCFLSADHVLALVNQASISDTIIQPGESEIGDVTDQDRTPLPLPDLAYLIVRIVESFVFSDLIAGNDPDWTKVGPGGGLGAAPPLEGPQGAQVAGDGGPRQVPGDGAALVRGGECGAGLLGGRARIRAVAWGRVAGGRAHRSGLAALTCGSGSRSTVNCSTSTRVPSGPSVKSRSRSGRT